MEVIPFLFTEKMTFFVKDGMPFDIIVRISGDRSNEVRINFFKEECVIIKLSLQEARDVGLMPNQIRELPKLYYRKKPGDNAQTQ